MHHVTGVISHMLSSRQQASLLSGPHDWGRPFNMGSGRYYLTYILSSRMNNYIVRSYRDVIVITKSATRRVSKTKNIVKNINKNNRLTMAQFSKVLFDNAT